jgi:predicted dehydrogenase
VWTPDPKDARAIAAASRVEHVSNTLQELIGSVDAVLLARDDAENHRRFAEPALLAGLPVFVDKPLATSKADAAALLALERYEGQVFSCSSLRYAAELTVGEDDRTAIGEVRLVEAITPKRWETYAVHAIEPIVAAFASEWGSTWRIRAQAIHRVGDLRRLSVELENDALVSITATGRASAPIGFRIHGEAGTREYRFSDSFTAFRASLAAFVEGVHARSPRIPREQTMQVVDCIERGLSSA